MSEEYSKNRTRVKTVEEAIQILKKLLIKADERTNKHPTWINHHGKAQERDYARIAALADAQIRTEETVARLSEAQARTDACLDALIDIVRKDRNGQQ